MKTFQKESQLSKDDELTFSVVMYLIDFLKM